MKENNLLYIMADEHNPQMLGCYGHDQVQTPNLDRLAGKGDAVYRRLHQLPHLHSGAGGFLPPGGMPMKPGTGTMPCLRRRDQKLGASPAGRRHPRGVHRQAPLPG